MNLWLDAVADRGLVHAIFSQTRYWRGAGLSILDAAPTTARPIAITGTCRHCGVATWGYAACPDCGDVRCGSCGRCGCGAPSPTTRVCAVCASCWYRSGGRGHRDEALPPARRLHRRGVAHRPRTVEIGIDPTPIMDIVAGRSCGSSPTTSSVLRPMTSSGRMRPALLQARRAAGPTPACARPLTASACRPGLAGWPLGSYVTQPLGLPEVGIFRSIIGTVVPSAALRHPRLGGVPPWLTTPVRQGSEASGPATAPRSRMPPRRAAPARRPAGPRRSATRSAGRPG